MQPCGEAVEEEVRRMTPVEIEAICHAERARAKRVFEHRPAEADRDAPDEAPVERDFEDDGFDNEPALCGSAK